MTPYPSAVMTVVMRIALPMGILPAAMMWGV